MTGTFTDLWLAHSNLPFSFGTIAYPYQSLRSINYRTGAVIVYLLFTEEKLHYFLLINNLHVWVGWGTKSHSLSVFFPPGCVFMCEAAGQTGCLCCVSEQTTDCALLTADSPVLSLLNFGLSVETHSVILFYILILNLKRRNFQLLTQKLNLTDCWTIPHPTTLTEQCILMC